MDLIGRPSKRSPRTFSARSYEAFDASCETWFTFELGHLLDEGIDPVELSHVTETCSNCGAKVTLRPADVLELV